MSKLGTPRELSRHANDRTRGMPYPVESWGASVLICCLRANNQLRLRIDAPLGTLIRPDTSRRLLAGRKLITRLSGSTHLPRLVEGQPIVLQAQCGRKTRMYAYLGQIDPIVLLRGWSLRWLGMVRRNGVYIVSYVSLPTSFCDKSLFRTPPCITI